MKKFLSPTLGAGMEIDLCALAYADFGQYSQFELEFRHFAFAYLVPGVTLYGFLYSKNTSKALY